MTSFTFVHRQVAQIRNGGSSVLLKKLKTLPAYVLLWTVLYPLFAVLAVPLAVAMRLARPWILVRIGRLESGSIGHLAANTELHLCERSAGINVPEGAHLNLYYMPWRQVGNQQLARMWRRVLRVWPCWILLPLEALNRLLPGGEAHCIVNLTSHEDRDIHNLLDRFPPHLAFTPREEAHGQAAMRAMGIPPGAPFVCMNARDSAYFVHLGDGDFRDGPRARDADIQNFVLAALELAERGYYVIRMGAKVKAPMRVAHSRILDYATNGARSDFMDVYLGANCEFCVSTGTGFDAVPLIFRRPIVFVNYVPVVLVCTYSNRYLSISKHCFSLRLNRLLTLREITGADFMDDDFEFEDLGIRVVENTPEEIRDVVVEMVERLRGTWLPEPGDAALQESFWRIFPADARLTPARLPLHGEIRGRFGAAFLRGNPAWLQ